MSLMTRILSPTTRDILREQQRTIRYAIERPRTARRVRERAEKHKELRLMHNFYPALGVIFVHIPKTAGTSVHQILSAAEETVAREGNRRPRLHKHATAAEWRDALGESTWESMFSFCLVRNPYDLMVSSYFWWLQKAKNFPATLREALIVEEFDSFDHFMQSDFGKYRINEFPGTMSDWYTSEGADIVNFVGQVENFDECMKYVLSRTDAPLSCHSSVRENSSERSHWREYYTEEARRVVARRFSDVMKRFDYGFED